MVVWGNATTRHSELACDTRQDTRTLYLLGTKGADLGNDADKILPWAWGQLVVGVHTDDTSDAGKNKKNVLKVKHRLLGRG